MEHLKLKRILKKQKLTLLSEIIDTLEDNIAVQDNEGNWLIGEGKDSFSENYSIEIDGELIGNVMGGQKALVVKNLLVQWLHSEAEKKALGRETLEKYKELSLLYNIAHKMTNCLELKEVAKLVLEEAVKLIESSSASVMLLNRGKEELETISAWGKNQPPNVKLKPGQGIAGIVVETGKAEIVNDVASDPRFIPGSQKIGSLICAPLKTKENVIGVINISSEEPVVYPAENLKLLIALASQAASAIENALFHENKLKEAKIKSHLERYISPQVVQAIIESKGNISLSPAKKKIVCLFSDIRNFTTTCERLQPEEIVKYLNQYLTKMVEIIFQNQGTVNKFVGDMIVSLFGAPFSLQESEKQAIETAIEMQKSINSFPEPWIRNNFSTGIGLNMGDVVVGNIGSPHHMDYTVIGDEVNIASRLQSMAKGGQILVSRSIYDTTKTLFEFKEIGSVPLKGREQNVEVFEVIY